MRVLGVAWLWLWRRFFPDFGVGTGDDLDMALPMRRVRVCDDCAPPRVITRGDACRIVACDRGMVILTLWWCDRAMRVINLTQHTISL